MSHLYSMPPCLTATEQNGVAGTLPIELSSLKQLQALLLEEGILTGTIPTELGMIRTLEQIDLNFNLLQGPLPEEIYLLTNLRQLDLNDNELTGTISENISNLTQLSFFQIEVSRQKLFILFILFPNSSWLNCLSFYDSSLKRTISSLGKYQQTLVL